jgi:hypothetical protein
MIALQVDVSEQLPQVNSILRHAAGVSSPGFSLTQVFNEPGVYNYVDARFGASMTGTVYVSPLSASSSESIEIISTFLTTFNQI